MRLKPLLKSIIPQCIISYRRLGKELPIVKKQIDVLGMDEPFAGILLIGTPLHENLGDHLITLGTREFLSREFPEREVVEIPLEGYRLFWKRLKPKLSEDCTILINGGGWMGDLYPEDDRVIRHVAEHFSENAICVLPQTLFYQNEDAASSKHLIADDDHAFESSPDFALLLRERASFELARKLFPSVKSSLVPDMAFAYFDKAPKGNAERNDRIGLCLRADKEKKLDDRAVEMIVATAGEFGKEVVPISTMAGSRVYSNERKSVVDAKLEEFAKCDLIITDRLHAMLFSFLANTPCIAFDNSTNKVSGVYNAWLKDNDNVILLSTPEQLFEAIERLENDDNDDKVEFSSFDFGVLKELIVCG